MSSSGRAIARNRREEIRAGDVERLVRPSTSEEDAANADAADREAAVLEAKARQHRLAFPFLARREEEDAAALREHAARLRSGDGGEAA